ncbi:NAD(P)H-dependent flavin oxidoreductase YrpB (nitropropane dioxygenase family) [Thermosipho japonicus]|uniref:NAD(P)H-dependent flavin oxidoreductase YrpB (Nitropropane dioxygenase family) n=1 Tax=Thermosipho japonicus TaxID=90323 RepID=A0A841GVA0_9BACT|nr:nitronate monooxygenase [Thermosipho japonicus]MBB6062871.1 NAD(P)H-dependent flavin oxidoreductase YrpB (nitropropane dioxygenase family) [Thermosipho japonicus]
MDLPVLKIGNLISKLPIIQGGMSVGISLSGLASAVANEGGIGVIGAAGIGMFEDDFNTNYREANIRALRKEIRKAKKLSDGIIGVNIMVALSDFSELIKASIEEHIDIIFVGAGLALDIPAKEIKESGVKIVPIVSSKRAASLIIKYWKKHYDMMPDAIVVEGPKAGGHLGFKRGQIFDPEYSLEKILKDVIKQVNVYEKEYGKKIPVIAAGGIYSGGDIYKFLKLGADGVQMATRFVATKECDASDEFKKMYVNCRKEDIVIIDSPVGLPGRAIKNEFIESVEKGEKRPIKCSWKCLKTCDFRKVPYCIAKALTNAKLGFLKEGFAFAGENAYKVKEIISVKELISRIKKEFLEAQLSF